jgi:hypothetical protein
MEVARDLQDHQLVDRDDQPCGRVDDITIELDESGARLGALLSGSGVLLAQLGVIGGICKRLLPEHAAHSHLAIEWRQVRSFEPQHICLLPPRDRLRLQRARDTAAQTNDRQSLSALLQTPVIDSNEEQMEMLDIRTHQPHPPAAPRVLGLLCMHAPRLSLLGLKRHDGGLLPQPRRNKEARFVPWQQIQSLSSDAIHLNAAFAELPRLSETPASPPPATTEHPSE